MFNFSFFFLIYWYEIPTFFFFLIKMLGKRRDTKNENYDKKKKTWKKIKSRGNKQKNVWETNKNQKRKFILITTIFTFERKNIFLLLYLTILSCIFWFFPVLYVLLRVTRAIKRRKRRKFTSNLQRKNKPTHFFLVSISSFQYFTSYNIESFSDLFLSVRNIFPRLWWV